MDDVRLAAGCSKGGLYHHFPTKAALLASVIERLMADAQATRTPESAGTQVGLRTARILIDVWAAAARDDALRAQLRAATSVTAAADDSTGSASPLDELLRIGGVVQSVAVADADGRGQAAGADRAA